MKAYEKSDTIKEGIHKSFLEGKSKIANRKCFGYDATSRGLIVNRKEAQTVHWIFERYLAGYSLGSIVDGLAKQRIPSPTGRTRWNKEAIDKLLSNEKYIGNVLLQKTVSDGGVQIENDGLMEQYLYTDTHEAIISAEQFKAVQKAKRKRSNCPREEFAITRGFW